MMNRELYIGGKKIDLPDNVNFNLVWQVAKPGELKIYGSGSSTIKLPFTPANDGVFERARFLNVRTGIPFATFNARYYEDNILMFDDGKAYLVAVSDAYEIALTWGNTDYIQKLKDTPIYTLSLGAFKWDNTQQYPLAETSSDMKNLPALYTDSAKALKFRHALSRPIIYYSDLLKQVGITKENTPQDIMLYVSTSYIQINNKKAIGRYYDAQNLVGNYEIRSYSGLSVNPQQNPYITTFERALSIQLEVGGTFKIGASNPLKDVRYSAYAQDQSYAGLCFFLTKENLGENGYIGRGEYIYNAFSDYERKAYQPMYKVELETFIDESTGLPHYSWNLTNQEYKPVAVGYIIGDGSLYFVDINDFSNNEIELNSGTYYLYVCQKGSNRSVSGQYQDDEDITLFQTFFELQGVLLSTELYDTSAATEVLSPEDPILSVNPPDMITMLGYETAYDVVDDFMKIFPLMVMAIDGKLQYFGFREVRDNKSIAYDWSSSFLCLDKTNFGNSELASVNWLRFAEYDGYMGIRADGSFDANGCKESSKDYAVLSRLTNYDKTLKISFKETPVAPDTNLTISSYVLGTVDYDKDTDSYAQSGLEDMPNILFGLSSLDSYHATENGKDYNLVPVHNNRNTFYGIINQFWRDFIEVCGSQRTVTIKAVLHARHLSGFDFRRPVYFRQLGMFVFVQKITYKGHAESTIEGIII